MTSFQPKISNPFPEIEEISHRLEKSISASPSPGQSKKAVDADVQRISAIVKDKMPQLIEDIAKHPEHAETWRQIGHALQQVDPHDYESIHNKVANMIRIGSTLSKPVDEIIKTLDHDLMQSFDALKNNHDIEQNLKLLGLILTNHFKLFRGVAASDGKTITQAQLEQLNDILNRFKEALNSIDHKEVKDHPNFARLQRLIRRLETHDTLGFLTQIPKSNILKYSEATQESLKLIREAIVKKPREGYISLAAWINHNKIRLADYNFTKEELQGIQPHLRYADFSGFKYGDTYGDTSGNRPQKELFEYLEKCPKLETLVISETSITTLPSLQTLKYLDCTKCTSLRTIPPLPALEALDCSACYLLNTLGEMQELKQMTCINCAALTTLANLPALETLFCRGCDGLTTLGEMRKLKELNCWGCQNLTTLPALPSLETLMCCSCPALTTLGEMPALKSLNCRNCSHLTDLPVLPALKVLQCNRCNALTTLSEMRALEELDCEKCHALETLPSLPTLQKLNCSNCVELAALGQMPALEILNCGNCPSLTTLPAFPTLGKLLCFGCTHLTTLGDMPALEFLDCVDCPSLTLSSKLAALSEKSEDIW